MHSKTRRRLLGAAAATTALGLTTGLARPARAQAKPIELKLLPDIALYLPRTMK